MGDLRSPDIEQSEECVKFGLNACSRTIRDAHDSSQ
jgi:hypothetical protein